MEPEDAYVALFQLRAHPSHDFWSRGRRERTAPAPGGSLHFVDLRVAPAARLRDPVDTLMFHLPRAALDEIAEDAGAPRVHGLSAPYPWRTPDPVVGEVQKLLIAAVEARGTADTILNNHLMFALAGHFATTYGGLQPGSGLQRAGLAPWQERRAKELLATNLSSKVSVRNVAQECGLSVAYFGRAFKASAGISPYAWLQGRRVERAKELLLSPTAPLAEIAALCGFADQSHFSRIFVRHTELSPNAWRRLRREG